MSSIYRGIFCLSIAVFSFFVGPISSSAGILETIPGVLSNGSGPGAGGAWQGSAAYTADGSFEGTVDYAVMGAFQFSNSALAASGYTPTADYVYLYQLNHTISTSPFDLPAILRVAGVNPDPNNPISSGIGSFGNDPNEVAVDTQGFGLVTGDAAWTVLGLGVPAGQSSQIMVFSSVKPPILANAYDFGALPPNVEPVPIPGAGFVPEPASAALLCSSLVPILWLCGVRTRRARSASLHCGRR